MAAMFLRSTSRKKNGKQHRYFSIVENKRLADGRVVQHHVLYLGEINSSQELAWRKSIEVFEEGKEKPSTFALFAEDRCAAEISDESIVRVRLSELRLCRPQLSDEPPSQFDERTRWWRPGARHRVRDANQ